MSRGRVGVSNDLTALIDEDRLRVSPAWKRAQILHPILLSQRNARVWTGIHRGLQSQNVAAAMELGSGVMFKAAPTTWLALLTGWLHSDFHLPIMFLSQ